MTMLLSKPTGDAHLSSRRALAGSRSAMALIPPASRMASKWSDDWHSTQIPSSHTWINSSEESSFLSDTDELDDRSWFICEYSRLTNQHSIRPLGITDLRQHAFSKEHVPPINPKRSWFSRLLHSKSPHTAMALPPASITKNRALRRRRSVSEVAQNLVRVSSPQPQGLDLQALVRICGKSVLYLPYEYTPGPLVLPTCIRATAQYLSQHADTGGIFRIPGSNKAVNAMFNYYCRTEKGMSSVAGTVRCPTLPGHFATSVHDVASTLKRFLAALPGGILGSLPLFDALVAVHAALDCDQKSPCRRQNQIRARLIALAIGTVGSHFQRSLICAVLGLLSLVGRTAETAPKKGDDRRPRSAGDLMGYDALGVIFGPLLLGDLLSQYKTDAMIPASGPSMVPISPTKLRKTERTSRSRRKSCSESGLRNTKTSVMARTLLANDVAEMLISNWLDIVKQLKSMAIHQPGLKSKLGTTSKHCSSSGSSYITQQCDRSRDGQRSDVQVGRGSSPRPDRAVAAGRPDQPQPKTNLTPSGPRGGSCGSDPNSGLERAPIEGSEVSEGNKSPGHVDYDTTAVSAKDLPRTPISNACNKCRTPCRPEIGSSENDETMCWPRGWSGHGSPGSPVKDIPLRTSSRQRHPPVTPITGLTGTKEQQGAEYSSPSDHLRFTRVSSAKLADEDVLERSSDSPRCVPQSPTSILLEDYMSTTEKVPYSRGKEMVDSSFETEQMRICPTAEDSLEHLTKSILTPVQVTPVSNAVMKGGGDLDELGRVERHELGHRNFMNQMCWRRDGMSSGLSVEVSAIHNGTFETGGKRSGVRAIAAKFEGAADVTQSATSKNKRDQPTGNLVGSSMHHSSNQPEAFSECSQSTQGRRHDQQYGRSAETSEQCPFTSLGRWLPHQEKPQVAQHLDLPRPTSSAGPVTLDKPSSSSPARCRGRTTSMHLQILSLQRQLELKREEAASLRRQLEAHEKSDVGTLSEQLREARRESRMWEDRAGAAERRVQVFERFARRLKDIRKAAEEGGEQDTVRQQPL